MYRDGTSKSSLTPENGGSVLTAASCTEKSGASQIDDENEKGY